MLSEDESTARVAYDQLAEHYDRAFPDLGAEAETDRALIDRFARSIRGPGPVLDVGCGTGRVTRHLGDLGLQAVGVDISEGMLALARARQPGVTILLGSSSRLPVADAAVSGLVAWYSIIHTAPDDLSIVFAEFARVLMSAAPVLVAFQSGSGERVERDTAGDQPIRRTNYRHDVDATLALLGQHGLEVQECRVRPPESAFETTPQAFVTAMRTG